MKKSIIFIGLFLTLGSVYVYQPIAYEILKLKTFDSFVKDQEPSGYFTVLNITEDDITNEGGYPLPRQRLAEVQSQLIQKGALGIGWVIAFPQPDRFGGDIEFKHSLEQAASVLAMFEGDNGLYPPTIGTVILGNDIGGMTIEGVIQNIDMFKQSTAQGLAVARTDVDNLIRRLPLLMRTPDGWTLGRKWISWVDTPQTDLATMDVQDKFVFIGFTAKGIMPQLATPVGLLEPHKIQASLAESILIQDSPYIPDYALALEVLIFIASTVFVWLVLNVFGITLGISFFAIVFLSTATYGVYTIQNGVLLDVTWALISQFITGSVAFYVRFREQYKLRQQIKKQFEHYLDPRQVKQLQKNPSLLKLGGEKRYATFLFTDVRGFTSMSETLEPEDVTYIMNKALTAQQSAVQKNGGMVDKYIGDAMMAIFNAPINQDFHENKAIDCAVDIQRNMESLNIELMDRGIPAVAIGIGINTGYAVIGNMGSESRFDYTAIGDAVNIGARLESGTKEAGVDVLIGYNTAIKSDYELTLLEPLQVKGKEKPLDVYTL